MLGEYLLTISSLQRILKLYPYSGMPSRQAAESKGICTKDAERKEAGCSGDCAKAAKSEAAKAELQKRSCKSEAAKAKLRKQTCESEAGKANLRKNIL